VIISSTIIIITLY